MSLFLPSLEINVLTLWSRDECRELTLLQEEVGHLGQEVVHGKLVIRFTVTAPIEEGQVGVLSTIKLIGSSVATNNGTVVQDRSTTICDICVAGGAE